MTRRERFFLVTAGAVAVLWAACARPEPDINRNMPDNTQPITVPTIAQGGRDPFANANSANLNANASLPVNATNAATVTELEDSVITSTNDNLGNRFETRVFRAHPRLSQVVVITSTKGRKEARVYGNKGEVKPLAAALVKNALIWNGDDLADAVGIAMDKSPKKNNQLPPLEKPMPTPTPKAEASPAAKLKPTATPAPPPEPEP
jgi:hypothetical protein